MYKTILIITGVIITTSLLLVWVYLLFFGVPNNASELFASFNTPDRGGFITTYGEEEFAEGLAVDTTTNVLNQITLRPVAGYGFFGTTTKIIRYVEKGTGHVYEINLETGLEEQISITTMPTTVEAFFSPPGGSFVLVQETAGEMTATFARTSTSTDKNLVTIPLPEDIDNIALKDDIIILYTRETELGAVGIAYNVLTTTETVLFESPLQDITVLWGEDTQYIYNKPAPQLLGSLFTVGQTVQPIASGYSLVVIRSGNTLIQSNYNASVETFQTATLPTIEQPALSLSQTIIPEKCALYQFSLWCASPIASYGRDYITTWYKGIAQESDYLWHTDLQTGESELTMDFLDELGYSLDVTNVQIANDGRTLLFTNRKNGTLWVFYIRA